MELKINSPKYGEKIVLIDDDDYEKIKLYKWYVAYDPTIKNFYVVSMIGKVDNKRKRVSIHRIITNAEKKYVVDHINGNTLDNRKINLRMCTHMENQRNSKKRNNKKESNYKGVYLLKNKKFASCIRVDKKLKHLGIFETEDQAAIAYNMAALKYFGEFARPNINIMMQ